MATHTTVTSDWAWRPDVQGFAPAEVLPTALPLQCSTVVGSVEGDQPMVRIPLITGASEPGFVAEGAEIPEGTGQLDEVTVSTRKLGEIGRFSREQLAQPGAAETIIREMSKGIIRSGNKAFIANATAPLGITEGLTATAVGTSLDSIVDAVAAIEAADGQATHIIASPSGWADLSKLKTATGSAEMLLGAGVEAGQRQLLGIPVIVDNAVPADEIVVLDKSGIFSAVGQVQVARSDEVAFTSDTSVIRLTWRLGWAVRPGRVALLSTAAA